MRRLIVAVLFAASALAQAPRIDRVSPAQGSISAETLITIDGANFDGAIVHVGNERVEPASRTASSFVLRMPPRANGYAVISARNAGGAAYGEFLYVPPKLEELPAGFITTVAGVGAHARDYGPAKLATILPGGLALAPDGSLLVAEPNHHKITRVRTDGTIERVTAVDGTIPGDGLHASEAQISFPLSVAVDRRGNIYIPDQTWRIRRIDAATGIITTLAGDGVKEYSGDGGPAVNARIAWCTHIAADEEDVFFIDFEASRIRRINLASGLISTFATFAQLDVGNADLGHLALDSQGNLYLAETNAFRIRKIDRRTASVTTFLELPRSPAPGYVSGVRAIAFDAQDNLHYGGSGRIVKVNAQGAFVQSWGNGTYEVLPDSAPAATSGLGLVLGIAIAPNGTIYFSNDAIGRVHAIDAATGVVSTVAGSGPRAIGENGPAIAAVINAYDVAAERGGTLLLNEALRLRRLERDGTLRTIGGTGSFVGKPRPARATETVLGGNGVELDARGEIEVSEESVITHIDAAGVAREIVGRAGACDYTGDGGPATSATLCQAWDAVRDRDGNLFIADTNNNRIRRVDAKSGVITTVVGNGGPVNGFERYMMGRSCGDGGPAIDACLNTPYGIAVDRDGNLFIADHPGIRRVDARTGIITTFADVGASTKLVFDSWGRLYAASIAGVFRIDAHGDVTRIAGAGGSASDAGFSGDGGPARDARVKIPSQAAGITIDEEGNLFFVDGHNLRVRAVRYGAVLAPQNASVTMSAGANGTVRALVRDAQGRPAPGVRVAFASPQSGAGCRLASGAAITGENGEAATTCAANCIAGSYDIIATAAGSNASASVTRTNTASSCKRRTARK
jgi:sugar lactone lactonase YvrE